MTVAAAGDDAIRQWRLGDHDAAIEAGLSGAVALNHAPSAVRRVAVRLTRHFAASGDAA